MPSVNVTESGPGQMEQANTVSLMALGDMGPGSMCGDGMGSGAGTILMKQNSSCTQDVRYKLRDLLAQTANGANASSTGNLSGGLQLRCGQRGTASAGTASAATQPTSLMTWWGWTDTVRRKTWTGESGGGDGDRDRVGEPQPQAEASR